MVLYVGISTNGADNHVATFYADSNESAELEARTHIPAGYRFAYVALVTSN